MSQESQKFDETEQDVMDFTALKLYMVSFVRELQSFFDHSSEHLTLE